MYPVQAFKYTQCLFKIIWFSKPQNFPLLETLTLSNLNRDTCLSFCEVMLQDIYFPCSEEENIPTNYIFFWLQSCIKGKDSYQI